MRLLSTGRIAQAREVVGAGHEQLRRARRGAVERSPRWAAETTGLLFITLLGLGVLLGFDYSLKNGLWGEWAFAMAVCSLGIWLSGHAIKHLLPEHHKFTPPKLWQAPLWAAVPLLGAPFAAITRWWGVALFLGVLVLLFFLLPRLPVSRPSYLEPIQWVSAVAAVGAVAAFAAAGTHAAGPQIADASRPVPNAIQLAYLYRPLLFFDGEERYFPMNIDAAMAHGLVAECKYALKAEQPDDCPDVSKPSELDPSYDYLAIDTGETGLQGSTGGRDSAYYVHAVDKDRTIYLDYWIYYAQNPEPVARHLLCAPGLRWSENTCFEHAGDWEGLVVVLEPCARSRSVSSGCRRLNKQRLRIVAVNYAAHRGLTRYSWDTLAQGWRKAGLIGESDERPLAFVALNSHATYPRPCRPLHGRERAMSRWDCGFDHTNGRLAWRKDTPSECDNTCLVALPINASGAATSWDAFPGRWGEQRCILFGGYCDLGEPPRAPAFQRRYKEPWHTK